MEYTIYDYPMNKNKQYINKRAEVTTNCNIVQFYVIINISIFFKNIVFITFYNFYSYVIFSSPPLSDPTFGQDAHELEAAFFVFCQLQAARSFTETSYRDPYPYSDIFEMRRFVSETDNNAISYHIF